MKNILVICCLSFFVIGCKASKVTEENYFRSAKIELLHGDKMSIRAISVTNDRVYYAGDKGRVGYVKFIKENAKINQGEVYDTLVDENRSIAISNSNVFVLNAGNPAVLRKYSKNLFDNEIVYTEKGEKVFYDSMQFWNDNEGIAIGDPIEGCFSIIITRNGGKTWTKVPCDKLPTMVDGEAAFAASNTNIVIKGNHTWLVSGGKKARVFYSSDKGKTWKVYETPIVQGETMTGIFTADFYNEKIGCIAGGNYEKLNQNFQNKAITTDGGKTWKLVGENAGFGYASCIQFVPNSNGKQLVCLGASGLFYSYDSGKNWNQLDSDPNLYTIRFLNPTTAIAAGKNKIVRIVFSNK